MPKQNKDSRFDRVIAGARRLNENKTLERADSASERFMQSRANKAMGEGKEWKAKAYAAAEGVRKAVMPTDNIGLAATALGAGGAAAKGVKAVKAASKVDKANKFNKAMARGRVASKNKVQEEAKKAGFRTVKTRDHGTLKADKRILVDPEKASDYAIESTRKNMDKVSLRKSKRVKKGKGNGKSYERPEVSRMRKDDMVRDFSYSDISRVSEEFTKRGKTVGKPIVDKGGKRVTKRTPQTEETKDALANSKDVRAMKRVEAAKNPKTHKAIDRFHEGYADWADNYGAHARAKVNQIVRRYEKKPKTKIVGGEESQRARKPNPEFAERRKIQKKNNKSYFNARVKTTAGPNKGDVKFIGRKQK